MRHAEVAKAPGQRGNNAEKAVCAALSCGYIRRGKEIQIAGDRAAGLRNRAEATQKADAEADDHKERDSHDNALNQVRGGNRQKAAQKRIGDNDSRAGQHGLHVVKSEQAVKQLAYRRKAGRRIGNEEDDNDQGRDQGKQMLLIAEAPGEKARNRVGVDFFRIYPQSPGNQQPVQIGPRGKSDDGPAHVGDPEKIGQPRKPHKKIGTHIARLSAHGGNERT